MPSLNAIRAFEAVGRLLSLRGAAHELHVTPSAISHQIRALENYFGMPLLHMVDRRIRLTPAGDRYFKQISPGFAQVSAATLGLIQGKGERVLRISMPPALAAWWLIPRLEKFVASFPQISLQISASPARIDFALGQHDVAIRYTRAVESGLYAARLSGNHVFPVCSPQLVKGPAPLQNIADLRHHTLIDGGDEPSNDEPVGDWEGWLRAAEGHGIAGVRRINLTPRYLMLQAAVQGAGVGLARTLIASEAIAANKLVCPFGPAFPLSANYYFVCPLSNARNPDISIFRDWLLAEAQASAALIKLPQVDGGSDGQDAARSALDHDGTPAPRMRHRSGIHKANGTASHRMPQV